MLLLGSRRPSLLKSSRGCRQGAPCAHDCKSMITLTTTSIVPLTAIEANLIEERSRVARFLHHLKLTVMPGVAVAVTMVNPFQNETS
jgi:hypothetical protein